MRLFSSSANKTPRNKSSSSSQNWQHPDLPIDPPLPRPQPRDEPRPQLQQQQQQQQPSTNRTSLHRSSTVIDRSTSTAALHDNSPGDRRSIAVGERDLGLLYNPTNETTNTQQQHFYHAQTYDLEHSPPAVDHPPHDYHSWSTNISSLPSPSEQPDSEQYYEAPMNAAHPAGVHGKSSSDTASSIDRWSARRVQRLNTEQGFRDSRSGNINNLSSPVHADHHPGAYPQNLEHQPQLAIHHQPQPHQAAYQHPSRSGLEAATSNPGFPGQTHPSAPYARSGSYSRESSSLQFAQNSTHPQQQQQQQHSLSDAGLHYQQHIISPSHEPPRPSINQRSYSQQPEDTSMSASNNGAVPNNKPVRSSVAANRQSVHNGLTSREGSNMSQHGVPAFSASVVPPDGQNHSGKDGQGQQGNVGRATPQPSLGAEEMTEEEVTQLLKDHKELREKYTKVKKYYFEKEDQVKQLQNSLAHQRLSQSRTSLDDSEYTTRFNRLDGLIAQLAFSIRKNWKSLPAWLLGSVNKDAIVTGKQEMTAAGRAFISCWLVSEVFNKYFHPDLDLGLSSELKKIQLNMRRYAPPSHNAEEEEFLTSKVVNWRLSTLEGLTEALRSPQCADNRAKLTDFLKDSLIATLAEHLTDPPPSDLQGGVHMIIELAVSIAIHLPVESRDVSIEYFMPGYSIMQDQMKLESSALPPLTVSLLEDQAERASTTSDGAEMTEVSNQQHEQPKKRSMLSAFTGSSKSKSQSQPQQSKHGAGGSSSSLNRPESSQGMNKEEMPPRVRMAAGICVAIRGRSVLVKAPIFST